MSDSSRPLWVQADRTLLLEVDHPCAREAQEFLPRFAELEKSPERFHTYRITSLSLWNAADGQKRLDVGIDLVQSKMRAGRLEGRQDEVQLLGRLLSTRHKPVQLAGRGRLLIPEGYRQFLRVEPNSELLLVGAAICIEIWNPTDWMAHLEGQMPHFNKLFDQLTS